MYPGREEEITITINFKGTSIDHYFEKIKIFQATKTQNREQQVKRFVGKQRGLHFSEKSDRYLLPCGGIKFVFRMKNKCTY